MNISFIGAGNIASAIIGGITKENFIKKENIYVYDVVEAVCEKYKNDGFNVASDIEDVLAQGDIIFLTVKPQFYASVLEKMDKIKDKTIVTVAPGITISKVKSYLDKSNSVIRTMPNTPLMVGEGMTVVAGEEGISEEKLSFVIGMFEKSGKVIKIKEELIDSAIGVFSSSPAYVYMFIEALADGGVFNGLDRKSALEMAAQAVYGSAKMVLETGIHPAELKDMVCSPNGTTIRAVKALEDNGFRGSILNAMDECYKRAKELGK
jgi:pyrroline-5-carboxylate reductase